MRRDVFQAMADPVRREIIELLADEILTVSEVADHFEISRPAISKQLKILEECGLIHMEQKGRARYCRIQPKELIPAFLWIDKYRNLWEEKIDSFEAYIIQLQSKNQEL
ncbi:MAG: metalloregulator ArsR/SmtB family transcription factor [Flavobacteriaceae bacterium]